MEDAEERRERGVTCLFFVKLLKYPSNVKVLVITFKALQGFMGPGYLRDHMTPLSLACPTCTGQRRRHVAGHITGFTPAGGV